MLDAVFDLFFCLAANFCGEGTVGDVDDIGFGAGSAVIFDAASAPLLLEPKEQNYPGGDVGRHVLREVYVLKVIPKTMPKTGDKVAVELREGSGRGAASGPTLVARFAVKSPPCRHPELG
jgi:hypothetical protein